MLAGEQVKERGQLPKKFKTWGWQLWGSFLFWLLLIVLQPEDWVVKLWKAYLYRNRFFILWEDDSSLNRMSSTKHFPFLREVVRNVHHSRAFQLLSRVQVFVTCGLAPSPGSCSNSCPSSLWFHPTISSPVVPFSYYLCSFQASGSFLMSWLLALCSQSIAVSASTSILPMNIQDWFPLVLIVLISLIFKSFL